MHTSFQLIAWLWQQTSYSLMKLHLLYSLLRFQVSSRRLQSRHELVVIEAVAHIASFIEHAQRLQDCFTFDFALEKNDDLAVGLTQVADLVYYSIERREIRALLSVLKHALLAHVPVNLIQLVDLEDLVDEPRVSHAANEHVNSEAIVAEVDVVTGQSLPLE